MQQQSLCLDEFFLKRSRRKTIAIHVSSNGVEIRAPYYASLKEIREFVEKKALWILEHQQYLLEREKEIYKIDHGETISWLGAETLINILPGNKNQVSQKDGGITISAKNLDRESIIKVFEKWVKTEASAFLKQRTTELAKQYQLHNKVQDIRFRKTKTKWGHCTADGTIQLNWLLVMAPPEVIDYVITHELCHLVHLNHSKKYWLLVESFLPDYKARQQWIKQHGHKLYFC